MLIKSLLSELISLIVGCSCVMIVGGVNDVASEQGLWLLGLFVVPAGTISSRSSFSTRFSSCWVSDWGNVVLFVFLVGLVFVSEFLGDFDGLDLRFGICLIFLFLVLVVVACFVALVDGGGVNVVVVDWFSSSEKSSVVSAGVFFGRAFGWLSVVVCCLVILDVDGCICLVAVGW